MRGAILLGITPSWQDQVPCMWLLQGTTQSGHYKSKQLILKLSCLGVTVLLNYNAMSLPPSRDPLNSLAWAAQACHCHQCYFECNLLIAFLLVVQNMQSYIKHATVTNSNSAIH